MELFEFLTAAVRAIDSISNGLQLKQAVVGVGDRCERGHGVVEAVTRAGQLPDTARSNTRAVAVTALCEYREPRTPTLAQPVTDARPEVSCGLDAVHVLSSARPQLAALQLGNHLDVASSLLLVTAVPRRLVRSRPVHVPTHLPASRYHGAEAQAGGERSAAGTSPCLDDSRARRPSRPR